MDTIFYIISIIFSIFFLGKKSVKNKENKDSANQVKKFNDVKNKVSQLSNSDLSKRVKLWKKARDKTKL